MHSTITQQHESYLMESDAEIMRLELKTDSASVARQAQWPGIGPGMRVADIGCGSGKTTYCLHQLTQPGGGTVGVDISAERISYAQQNYCGSGIEYVRMDCCLPMDELGQFDFVWVRFLLEYYRTRGVEIVRNAANLLRPGGVLCLIDLDYNCLSHFGLAPRLERAINGVIRSLEQQREFDPYAGRKLYSYLYDLGCQDIRVEVSCHHLIFGDLNEKDAFNWLKKVEVATRKANYRFDEYAGGYDEFRADFKAFFTDPRRFTYTPVICGRGRKPEA